jgi:hypothetical protein
VWVSDLLVAEVVWQLVSAHESREREREREREMVALIWKVRSGNGRLACDKCLKDYNSRHHVSEDQ